MYIYPSILHPRMNTSEYLLCMQVELEKKLSGYVGGGSHAMIGSEWQQCRGSSEGRGHLHKDLGEMSVCGNLSMFECETDGMR